MMAKVELLSTQIFNRTVVVSTLGILYQSLKKWLKLYNALKVRPVSIKSRDNFPPWKVSVEIVIQIATIMYASWYYFIYKAIV